MHDRRVSDLEEAWNAVHDATPKGWHVGRPSYHDERRQCGPFLYPSREVLSRDEHDVAATARRDQVEVEEDAQNAEVVLYVEHLEPSEPGRR